MAFSYTPGQCLAQLSSQKFLSEADRNKHRQPQKDSAQSNSLKHSVPYGMPPSNPSPQGSGNSVNQEVQSEFNGISGCFLSCNAFSFQYYGFQFCDCYGTCVCSCVYMCFLSFFFWLLFLCSFCANLVCFYFSNFIIIILSSSYLLLSLNCLLVS